jgi:hypothetical protein
MGEIPGGSVCEAVQRSPSVDMEGDVQRVFISFG